MKNGEKKRLFKNICVNIFPMNSLPFDLFMVTLSVNCYTTCSVSLCFVSDINCFRAGVFCLLYFFNIVSYCLAEMRNESYLYDPAF